MPELKDLVRRDRRSRQELALAAGEADRWVVQAFTVGGAIIGAVVGVLRAGSRRSAHYYEFLGVPLAIVLVCAIAGALIGRKIAKARAR